MADSDRPSRPRSIPPLRLDSATLLRRSREMSPTQSSVQSSSNHTPSSSVPNTPLFPVRAPSPERRPVHPADSTSFLTALAAQERRVLELKEEVQKAEAELGRLKKQWAAHEATKKKNELRHLEQMQPFSASQTGPTASHGDDSGRLNKELDRRKMMPSSAKTYQRTVFLGSRHTRTLSLLSPKEAKASHGPSSGNPPPRRDLETVNNAQEPSTVHELSTSTDGAIASNELYKGPPKDLILETGKQLVGDFRQGLWTFFEDLRHVTVGDEAASTSDPRSRRAIPAANSTQKQPMRERAATVKELPSRKADTSGSLQAPARQQRKRIKAQKPPALTEFRHVRNVTTNSSDSDDDEWDNWDTPKMKGVTAREKGTASPMASPLTDMSSARTSLR